MSVLDTIYTIIEIDGDYALCETEGGRRTNIALALLPEDIDEGDRVLFSNFSYEKL